ncbi:MAG: hypothetical protein B7Z76_14180 [Acidiphilium sp. 20-67-58]|nr:MAG: hypothetical protein B7Z76_14180 [Acidiphilium sp. 20-67-58]
MPDFHTPLFRQFGQGVQQAIEQVKTEAVSNLTEEPTAHAERIGRIRGLMAAVDVAVLLDKHLAGVS